MNKGLVYINIIPILFIKAVYILEYYVMNYPMMFDFLYIIKKYGLEYLAVIFAITALVSYLVSHLKIKNFNSNRQFLNSK